MPSDDDTAGAGLAKARDRSEPTDDEVLLALGNVVRSDVFDASVRLQDFLTYVVQEKLRDPEIRIPAKTIAQDVYKRSPDDGANSENIVRVDAGRLRRRLVEYYAGTGGAEPVQIAILSGGYVPEFSKRPVSGAEAKSGIEVGPQSKAGGLWRVIGVAGLAFIAGGAIVHLAGDFAKPDREVSRDETVASGAEANAERRAVMAKSPASLQAVTLSDQARGMIFPMFETEKLELALAMFRQAIRKDAQYYGSFAGAAQVLATKAIFHPMNDVRSASLTEARAMADRSLVLAPSEAWTQSALAWVSHAEGNPEEAREHAEIALQLAPEHGNILDFHALLMLALGDFNAALGAADPERPRTDGSGAFANRAFYGAAKFHVGRYEEAIASLLAGTFAGEPMSAPNLAYISASQQALGNTREAKKLAEELAENWPGFDARVVLGRLYVDPEQAALLQELIEDARSTSADGSN